MTVPAQVRDVMTRNVITVSAGAGVLEAARLMLDNRISGLPVVDAAGELVGMVTEGDLLRRNEIGTARQRPKWLEFLLGPGRLADEYVHASGKKVQEIMTPDAVTVTEDDSLQTVVELMERRHIKRLVVLRDGRMVGIVSRANLLRALSLMSHPASSSTGGDVGIRERVVAAIRAQAWAPRVDVAVEKGVVALSGTIADERQRQALIVAAENIPGVREVQDHLAWVEPLSGLVVPSPQDEAQARSKA